MQALSHTDLRVSTQLGGGSSKQEQRQMQPRRLLRAMFIAMPSGDTR
jgi:hypothetical protein